jgi:pimeloyl-ACP methyl ester carboxylesterase
MSAIVIEGSVVHYETIGRGRPIIFLHGWLGSWRYWMHTMEEASASSRSYAFDFWGFGDTDRAKGRQALNDFVKQIEAFMETTGMWRVTLIGHALGAAAALKFAGLFPARVERLMAVSLPISKHAVNRKALAGGRSLFGGYRWQDYEELTGELKKTDPSVIEPSIDSLDQDDLTAILAGLSMPVMLVNGGKDPIVRPFGEEVIPPTSYNTRLIQFDDSRHFAMLEERGKFDRLIKDFLAAGDDLRALELKEEWRRRTR